MKVRSLGRGQGFTVVELLIVLTVLAIFAAIAIPRLLPMPERPSVAHAAADLRALAISLDGYFLDNKAFPPAVDDNGAIVPFSKDDFTVSSGHVPWMLTTPVAHQSSIPFDPFAPKRDTYWARTYRYATNGKTRWIMTSMGEDKDADMVVEDYIRSASGDIRLYLSQFGGPYIEYDPTNGTISDGDVLRTGP